MPSAHAPSGIGLLERVVVSSVLPKDGRVRTVVSAERCGTLECILRRWGQRTAASAAKKG
ncbi:hypothetical protein [Natrialba swarupiae]|uniref:Uncharacterized protein n=1 Tax=Natrialba swarupiae TaxID=2448032 RepID=A0A5D5AJH3_9EURY|nr:hypothetical protein [Natrialba swarupiae]TYT61314.1 hypothetical protein FYC77_13960 [Natrialba swarupiae]